MGEKTSLIGQKTVHKKYVPASSIIHTAIVKKKKRRIIQRRKSKDRDTLEEVQRQRPKEQSDIETAAMDLRPLVTSTNKNGKVSNVRKVA